MWIETLRLENFRNFVSESFSFSPSFNVLLGANAQGKTSVLEAFAFLANGNSFRSSDWRDAILHGSREAHVRAKAQHELGSDEWFLSLNSEKKVRSLNDKRSASTLAKLVTILFAPEEIQLLRESPGARRRYVDQIIRRYDSQHWTNLRSFERVLKQRQAILHDEEKSISARASLLEIFDEQHAHLAAKLVSKRAEWLEKLNRGISKAYAMMAPHNEQAQFVYQPWFGAWQNQTQSDLEGFIRSELVRRRNDELTRRISIVGPHRDDILAQLGNKTLQRFGSQGEHRSFVLALKIAELELHQSLAETTPIFLLDDVSSELDGIRREFFFAALNQAKGQVMVTGTEQSLILLPSTAQVATFEIAAGKASKIAW